MDPLQTVQTAKKERQHVIIKKENKYLIVEITQ